MSWVGAIVLRDLDGCLLCLRAVCFVLLLYTDAVANPTCWPHIVLCRWMVISEMFCRTNVGTVPVSQATMPSWIALALSFLDFDILRRWSLRYAYRRCRFSGLQDRLQSEKRIRGLSCIKSNDLISC
jgi:hypothetical protein